MPGSRDDTARAVLKAAETTYYAGHTWNSFFYQGTKTLAYEIWEQLGFDIPDVILFPTGSGSQLIGAYIGFMDLLKLNRIEKLPRLIAVQSENCAPLYEMYSKNLTTLPTISPQKTIAEGVAVAAPVRAKQMLDIIHETKGYVITVTEDEIIECTKQLCCDGFFVEPTSAVALAGLKRYEGSPQDHIVMPLTGHGLKSTL